MSESVSELSQLLALLQEEQAADARKAETSPELVAVQERLRDQFKNEGEPVISRLREIASSEDFKLLLKARTLDFEALKRRGISSDTVDSVYSGLGKTMSLLNNLMGQLQGIPRRIANLTPEDIAPTRYQQPSAADRISKDLRVAPANLQEVEAHVAAAKCSIARLVNVPRQSVETFRPKFPDREHENPAFQVTAE